MSNKLFFGDNLTVLREHVPDESVDLVYLDPPFNSQARYNVLFKSPREDVASAQVAAFLDFWSWGKEAEAAFHDLMLRGGSTASFLGAFRNALGESDMMAYLVMMAARISELRRALKNTGSLYLHCDQTAGHYLKIIIDGIFGPDCFKSEITWKRSSSHGNVSANYGALTDSIFFVTRGRNYTWNQQYHEFSDDYVAGKFTNMDPDGRRWQSVSLRNPALRPNLKYNYCASNGQKYEPHPNGWAVKLERMQAYDSEGRLHYPARPGGQLRVKQYLDESKGVRLQNLWTDIPALNSQAKERIGYPTQKPIALLERIIATSSNAGDIILDPFCGCGTSVHAAEKLGRRWMGIDVSIHAIHVIEKRLSEAFGPDRVPKASGIPADFETAARLAASDPFQFQWWANYLVGVHILKEVKKGADRGIDGELFFPNGPGRPYGRMLTSVKAGKNVGPAMVREFRGVLEREKAEMGLFICLDDPTAAMEKEAVVAGFAPVVHGRVPRLQIVSMREWFAGRRPQLPPVERLPYAAFSAPKPIKKANRADPNAPELPFSFQGGKPKPGIVQHLNPLMVAERGDDLFSAG
ncbi:site-specific DNA-methyltransferase (adenine-specific) [Xanthobacter sp. SG618]|uniref:DNA methyltransferase n=1 Tax=Xanthobacter sp. SG618 TaxID=2587121 RepID=UPI00145E7C61|nr:site-specific DNA-methyltransferase (adenine-specific) [Xanthobacter sp. SG618]